MTTAKEARDEFHRLITSAGGSVLEQSWLGSAKPHLVRCVNGHEVTATPASVRRGIGCRVCSGKDPAAAWAAFRASVEELGGTVLEGVWKGAVKPHLVRCAQGHAVAVRPNGLQQGRPLCKHCHQRREASVFYVVSGDDCVKFGVTTDEHGRRMDEHARDGMHTPLFFRDGLTQKLAQSLEVTIHHALLRVGHKPVRGREYFPAGAIGLILSIATATLSC